MSCYELNQKIECIFHIHRRWFLKIYKFCINKPKCTENLSRIDLPLSKKSSVVGCFRRFPCDERQQNWNYTKDLPVKIVLNIEPSKFLFPEQVTLLKRSRLTLWFSAVVKHLCGLHT